MNIGSSRVRLLVGFVAVGGLGLAILFGLARVALGVGVSSATAPLAGSLDPAFGSGEIVTHDLGSGEYPRINGIAVQPDGKIVVAGGSVPGDHGLLLDRYLPDGTPDPSFGNGGYVETQVGSYAFGEAVALEPDGKIVVAVGAYPENAIARYNPDGSLDTSFGTGGITATSFGAAALAVLPSGDILAAGSVGGVDPSSSPYSSFALARYTPDGSLDPTFGAGGIVQTGFTGDDQLGGIAVQPDGKIVATGAGLGMGHGQEVDTMVLARYKPDGSLDPTFGNGGQVTTNPKLGYDGGPPALQGRKVIVAGPGVLARFEASGRLDTTFGKHGFAKIGGAVGGLSAVLAQKDGKILIALSSQGDLQEGNGAVARLLPNGRFDLSFGSGGIVPFPDELRTLALQTDSKILVGGGHGNAWTLTRLIGGNNCVVPGLRGKTPSVASATLRKSYCRRSHIAKRFSWVTRGRVITSTPPRGTRLPGGAKVDLVVSKGKRP